MSPDVLRRTALVCLCTIIVGGVLWEGWLAPLRPGGTMLVLKVLPLVFAVRGIRRGDLYTMQWSSMLILLYLAEGLVRATTDPYPMAAFASAEIVLSVIFFACVLAYVRPHKKAHRLQKKALAAESSSHHANTPPTDR